MDDEILDVEQACAFTTLSKSKIYQLKVNNKIPFHTIGDKILFMKSELIEWVKNNGCC